MTSKYYVILTAIGAAKLANATALGAQLEITHMAIGDGGGTVPNPNSTQTKLVNECYRAQLNSLTIDENNANQIIAEMVLSESVGGWYIRETGLYDAAGDLIAVANAPESYKPQLQEGSGRTQVVRMVLIVSSTSTVSLKIDPAVVLATRKHVEQLISEHEKSLKHPNASLTTRGFVQLNSATNSTNTDQAATPSAVKKAYDLAASKLSGVPAASTIQAGLTQLNDTINSTSTTQAATPSAVKKAYDLASSKLSKDANLSDVDSVADVLTNLGLNETVEKADISLSRARNLSDLNDIPQSRISLGLKGAALLDVGTSAEVAAGAVSKLVSIPALTAFFDLAATAINGSIRIPDRPGGIIFAWGTAPAGGSGTFTVAFNNPPFVMPQVASGQNTGAWDPVHVVVQSTSNTGFSTYNQSLARKYIAIGK